MVPTSGILYVTMKPKQTLPIAQFHDWYNNEHGPTRLRLPFIKNGFRYRATDLEGPGEGMPEWMAIYDVTDMSEMIKEPYTTLRRDDVKSQREKDTMKQIGVDRRIYDLVKSWESKEFKRLEKVKAETEENVLVTVSLSLNTGEENVKELENWYNKEHVSMLSRVPGWLRTRRFVTSSVEGKQEIEYLALHEYAPQNGLGGEEFKAATSTPWDNKIMAQVVQEKRRRTYELYYTFGPAPRELSALSGTNLAPFTSPDGQTRTLPIPPDDGVAAIESYVTTPDGVVLPYRLEGSPSQNAPLIVLSNSILVDWGIWDSFVAAFFSSSQNRKYRVLRYLTRGRSHRCGDQNITVDVLASDITVLLDALRIPKAAAVIGVSLGGATVLNMALKYPARVAAFMACDTNAKSPEESKKTWSERIVVAENEGAKAQTGETVVGEQLGELTVRRWFVKESFDGGITEAEIRRVKAMVESNSLEGFKKSVQALWQYDLQEEMKACAVRGAFVVGGRDGVLPGVMEEMAKGFGEGAEYLVIDGVGHLPMVERPREFAEVVTRFLGGS
ncbi:Dimeric alpha-beta barrel [Lasallia pustulata]|uniref:Dimeric alpha-beta barrel n=1 Tax=Lasallia pustulata TaxID=136370 RepID=A0A1W5D9P0_9LECA|nr:Dimeric alpha-beta barrel [Lasallia pustulata]